MSAASPELECQPVLPSETSDTGALDFLAQAGDEASLASTFTLTLWFGCVIVAMVGFALPYSRPKPSPPIPPPVEAEILTVELTNEPLLPVETPADPPDASQPPPLLERIIPPQAPPLIAVAERSPAIAFALPVEGPVRIVETKQATYVQPAYPATPVPAPAPPVQTITYGRGEGRQPAPEYPRQAVREGQEGTVVVRFSVGDDGRVIAAEASALSPWPLLNGAAVRVVRERWRFNPGTVRLYEVSIRFELTK